MDRRAAKRPRSRTPPSRSIQRALLSRRALFAEGLLKQRRIQDEAEQRHQSRPADRPFTGFEVERTPGQSLRLQRSIGVVQTPTGRLHRLSHVAAEDDVPTASTASDNVPAASATSNGEPAVVVAESEAIECCPDTTSRATSDGPNPHYVDAIFEVFAESGLDEEELFELQDSGQNAHLARWLQNLPMLETVREMGSTPIGVTTRTAPEDVVAHIAMEGGPKQHQATLAAASSGLDDDVSPIIIETSGQAAEVDPFRDHLPSTSRQADLRDYGMDRQPQAGRPFRFDDGGSSMDEDFDDDFDDQPEPIIQRDIPDDVDIDEHLRSRIHNMEMNMDEAHDRLLDMHVDFEWESNFDMFRGVRENFTGPTPGPVNDYETPYDAFVSIWDENIMGTIATETNRYATQTIDNMRADASLGPTSRLRRWVATSVSELYVFLGVFMLMGLDSRATLKDYWFTSNKFLAMPNFSNAMSYSRYILLNKFLHFVDNSTLQPLPAPRSGLQQSGEDRSDRRLQKLQPIIDYLNAKFMSLYNLLRDISIDESLLLFKGHLSWIQAIRTKAARFGLKSFEICEALTGYLYKFIIYTGATVDAPATDASNMAAANDLGGKTTKIVQKLMDGLWDRGHCLTMDNFYNSPALARYLKLRGTDCLGTLRPNRKHVPPAVRMPNNAPRGQLISQHCGDVSITTWKDAKPVTLISTYHDGSTFMGVRGGRPCNKPIVVRDYNTRMGGVDSKDQKLSYYLIERKRGVKWYIKMFKRLLNASIHNAWIMFNESRRRRNLRLMSQRQFRNELSVAIIDRNNTRVARPVAPPVETRLNTHIHHLPNTKPGRGRCVICYRNGHRKDVVSRCTTCGVFLCWEPCWLLYHSLEVLPVRSNQ